MQHAISELLQSNRIVRSITTPDVVNPLSVSVQSSGTLGLILDLRHVNNYIQKQNTKYKDRKTALIYFHKGYYMIYFDLKSGYHIHSHSQTFLGLAWKRPGDKTFTYYQFTVCSAPFIFTKRLKPLEKYWRSLGTNIGLCLGDGWLTESSYNECMNLATKIRADINNAGLVTNEQNSIWQP